ncbi:sap domain-containing protein [Colletotrichum truncatum]|uniref:Sap domain-containing protein n=1 Tax=Colletotrichum truncatum TaxID=5467 RepID=A0ACC3ZK42_COLTU|nr:sap domain-containing protein [Colletotrichum truncatum]KAF6799711.1 sap domain-containing protein [Colletotrichum truncatum]
MKDWSKQTVVQLKAELKRRGLGQAGLKQDLVARLTEDDAAAAVAENEAEASEPEPADSSEHQSVEAAEPTTDSAPVDDLPKEADGAGLEPTSTSVDEIQPSPPANDEPAAPTESDKPDVPAAGSETITPAEPTPLAPVEITQDAQKRKRRSESPVQSSEDVARKRIKAEQEREAQSSEPSGVVEVIKTVKESLENNTSIVEDIAKDAKDITENAINPPEDVPMAQEANEGGIEDIAMTAIEDEAKGTATGASSVEGSNLETSNDSNRRSKDESDQARDMQDASEQTQQPTRHNEGDAMDVERDVQPAIHPATRALYIKNFMRPLRENAVQAHLIELAAPAGAGPNEDDVEEFFVDQIRTHAFAVFKTTAQASRVRNALHDVIWPDERERKPLWVDFVPPEKVREWIDEEEAQGSRRRGARWEVLYDREDDGFVVARLDSGTAPPPALTAAPEQTRSVPSGPAVKDVNNIPLGPRAGRGTDNVPLGPRGEAPRGPGGRNPRQIPGFPGGPVQTTHKNPPISFQPVSEDLANRRIRNMRSFYTQDLKRDMGPETDINRYTFEQGDSFVDRGQEVFVGIRPPHREAQRRRDRGGGGGGPPRGPPAGRGRRNGNRRGGGPRPLSDRYLPGINESGPYRQGDRGNFGSRAGDRDRRF